MDLQLQEGMRPEPKHGLLFYDCCAVAEVKMRLGCLSLQNPPLKIGGPTELADEAGITGAPTELQEPLLWKPLGAEDFEIYEELYRDQGMIQARAVRYRLLAFRAPRLPAIEASGIQNAPHLPPASYGLFGHFPCTLLGVLWNCTGC